MVTAATTASSVSPPFFRMSMPRPSAFTPLALEMMSGRLPCAAGVAGRESVLAAGAGGGGAKRLGRAAGALPGGGGGKKFRGGPQALGPPCGGGRGEKNPGGGV